MIQLRDRIFSSLFSRLSVFTILFEDTDVEQRFFEVDERSRVLAVSAAGCGIASLLCRRPERIDAVDTNLHHLSLTGLKVSAAANLRSYDDLRALFGEGRHPRAQELVEALAAPLPPWMRRYWARRHRIFSRGLHDHGMLAASMRMMRARLGVDERWYRSMLDAPAEARQREAARLFGRLLAQPVAAAIVRSPLQLLAQGINFRQRDRNLRTCGTADMRDVVLRFVERAAATDLARNWILWHCLLGTFNVADSQALPPYLRPENHARSLGGPTRTEFHRRSFVQVLGAAPARTWTHYNFSDALDWMSDAAQRRVLDEVFRTSRPGALLLNRSVDRECLAHRHGVERRFQRLQAASDQATAMERSRLYERVDVYRIVH